MGQRGPAAGAEDPAAAPQGAATLPADPELFWGHRPPAPPAGGKEGGQEPGDREGGPIPDAEIPPVPAALARQLGSFPFWRGEQPFLPAMERIYQAASAAAAAAFTRLAAGAPAAGPEEPCPPPEPPAAGEG